MTKQFSTFRLLFFVFYENCNNSEHSLFHLSAQLLGKVYAFSEHGRLHLCHVVLERQFTQYGKIRRKSYNFVYLTEYHIPKKSLFHASVLGDQILFNENMSRIYVATNFFLYCRFFFRCNNRFTYFRHLMRHSIKYLRLSNQDFTTYKIVG